MRVFKHPEQMTPGTIWKVKGMKGLRYLEDAYTIGCNYKNWRRGGSWVPNAGNPFGTWILNPMPELDFDLGILYLLVDFQHAKGGQIRARFLGPNSIVEIELYEVFWDKAFRLAKRTRNPKKIKKLLFDKYDVNELKKKIGIEKHVEDESD